MVLEFCHKGALYDVLQTDKAEDITWHRVLRASIDTVKGLLCLHSWRPPIVHRDLKTLNLLVYNSFASVKVVACLSGLFVSCIVCVCVCVCVCVLVDDIR
jgi:serine/threonine protein kinase